MRVRGSLGFDRSLMLALRTPGAPDDPLGPRWFEDVMRDMTNNDAVRIRCLLVHHRRYTNSARAHAILENWTHYMSKFVKVMPVDYRRALMEMQAQQSQPALAVVEGR